MDPADLPGMLVTDVGLIGLLLLVGVWLRARVKALQWLMLPAPVIAGILGFLFGPHMFGAWAQSNGWTIGSWQVTGLPFSESLSSYTSILIAIVFGCMALSQDFSWKKMDRPLAAFTGYGVLMSAGQVFIGMLLVLLLLGPVFDASEPMGLILFTGWAGGFGTAAALGDVFGSRGQPEVEAVAFTSATLGMLTGIVVGVIQTRIGASKGLAKAFDKSKGLPDSLRTGVLADDEREPIGMQVTSGSSIESLSLHVAAVGLVVGLGLATQKLTAAWFNDFSLPLFAMAFLVGILLRSIFGRTKAVRLIDKKSCKSISGAASDVLIVCGIASIDPKFVTDNIATLIGVFVLGLVFCLFLGTVLAPRFLGEAWFERQIFTWGWGTGVVATGIALLRIVDPDLESGTLEDFGYAYLPLIPIEGFAAAVAPLLILAGASWSVVGIWSALAVAGLVVMVWAGHGQRRVSTDTVG